MTFKIFMMMTIVVLMFILIVEVHNDTVTLNKQIDVITDILKEQNSINSSVIEALQLRESPQYKKEVTDCNKKFMNK